MYKIVRKRFICFAACLCLLCSCAFVSGFCAIAAFADEAKTVQSVRYNSHEVLVAGKKADFKAEVTFTDGSTEMRSIRYADFPVNKMHDLFHDFNVRGYVDGSDEVINQTVSVLPANVVYMINLGSNLTETDYAYGSEGVLGKELDPTGATAERDPYNAAILRKFPDMLNKTGAKQFGIGAPSSEGDWGYVGADFTTQKVSGSAENTGRNLFKHLLFPKRGTKDITVKLALPSDSAQYDLHLGFYSYWFARPINIKLNGTEIKNSYSVSPSENVYTERNLTLAGETTVVLEAFDRSDAYAQALSSFVCVTRADTREYTVPAAPTAPEALDLTDTHITVSDLTPDTVLRFYDYDKQYLLYEYEVGEETSCTVALDEMDLNGVARLGVRCDNAAYMGETALVRRTDVENFTVSYKEDFVGEDLAIRLSAYARSEIVALRVYNDGELVVDRSTEPAADWSDTVYLSQNGKYRFEVESGSGGKGIEERTIETIDNGVPTVELTFNMQTAKASTAKSLVLGVRANSVSTVLETGYVFRGKTVAADFTGGSVSFSQSGNYTLYFVNALGKTGAYKTNVSMKPSDALTALIAEDTSKRFKQIRFTGRNGYKIVSVNVYGNVGDETEKMIVNGENGAFNFSVYKDGVYLAEIVTEDGTREFAVIDTLPPQVQSDSDHTGLWIGLGVGGGVLLLGGASVFTVFLIKKSKKQNKINGGKEK